MGIKFDIYVFITPKGHKTVIKTLILSRQTVLFGVETGGPRKNN
jgi:hypothetical protein